MPGYSIDDPEMPGHNKEARRPIVYAILAAGLLVALGLAVGLGLGLGSLKADLVTLPEVVASTTPDTPTVGTEKSKHGAYRFVSVASDVKKCSEIGTNILGRGGSAVDAAIATVICVGVFNCLNCGIGGGFFMTMYDRATGQAYALDARETAPIAANSSLFVGRESAASKVGGLAIAVPGEVRGYWEAHQRFGKLPWKELFEPTIKLCREGVEIQKHLYTNGLKVHQDTLRNRSFRMFFNSTTGAMLKEGDKMTFTRLGKTLETIANEGADAFYNGSLTDSIVAEIQDNGGIITKADLNGYKAKWKTPTNFTMRDGSTVYSMPPPGSGAVYTYMLNILDGYNFTADSVSSDDKTTLTYHRLVEAMKFAYAKRTELGDEDFEDIADLVTNLTSREFGDSIRAMISDNMTHPTQYYGPTYYTGPDQGTSQISVIDALGNAVSLTSTINFAFGSKVLGNTTGIIFNNEMDDFSTPGTVNGYGVPASPANFIKAGKRPLSSMTPSVVVDHSGDVILVIGGSGGTRITTAVTQVTLQTLKFERSAAESVDYMRVHHQLLPDNLRIEDGFPQEIRTGLMSKGHNITDFGRPVSNVVLVRVTNNMKYGVADWRKSGAPDGY